MAIEQSKKMMAIEQSKKIALFVFFFGLLSFILGILAENNKPQLGTAVRGKDVIICNFPANPSIIFGFFSVVTLILATIVGHISVYFPYEGKSIPRNVLFQNTTLFAFFIVAEIISVLAVVLLLWTTISESLHQIYNVHYDLSTQCASAKTGLFGGGAFLALDATLFWLIAQMLTLNARLDYLDDDGEVKRVYSQVYAYIAL